MYFWTLKINIYLSHSLRPLLRDDGVKVMSCQHVTWFRQVTAIRTNTLANTLDPPVKTHSPVPDFRGKNRPSRSFFKWPMASTQRDCTKTVHGAQSTRVCALLWRDCNWSTFGSYCVISFMGSDIQCFFYQTLQGCCLALDRWPVATWFGFWATYFWIVMGLGLAT